METQIVEVQGIALPSACQIAQVVKVQFRQEDTPILATVRGVHFFTGKVRYDLELWLDVINGEETYTRIYNVDSVFISPA